MSEVVLEAKHLAKTFYKGGVVRKRSPVLEAVKDVSFELKQGEVLGLLGPNGAGKTSIIQMLLGVLSPSRGEVSYFGTPLSRSREVLDRVNFSSTYTNLPWNLSIKECLTYSAYLYRIADRKAQIAHVVEAFGLTKLMNKQIQDLSSGQITRVNLAKAFLNNPEILLLDEPTASLDPESADYIRTFILGEQKRRALSILFTSHNMHEVEEVCDRIIFLYDGVIIANDTPDALASSVKSARMTLRIEDATAFDKAQLVATQESIPVVPEKKYLVFTISEDAIPAFLQTLLSQNIRYSEIEIDAPTLEDYFLAVSKRKPIHAHE